MSDLAIALIVIGVATPVGLAARACAFAGALALFGALCSCSDDGTGTARTEQAQAFELEHGTKPSPTHRDAGVKNRPE